MRKDPAPTNMHPRYIPLCRSNTLMNHNLMSPPSAKPAPLMMKMIEKSLSALLVASAKYGIRGPKAKAHTIEHDGDKIQGKT